MHAILLNSTPTGDFPLTRYIGAYKISHWIKKHGYTCQVIDYAQLLSAAQLYLAIEKFITQDTRVIGISTTFICHKSYLSSDGRSRRFPEHFFKVFRLIKAKYPKIKIILGGYMSDKVGFDSLADATLMSYLHFTEDIFLEYLEHLIKGTPQPLGQLLTGFLDQEKDKPRMWYHSARVPKYNIEHDDFRFTAQDAVMPGESLPMDISKGCIFACRFCQYPHIGKTKMDYVRGMELIYDELINNYEQFGTTVYHLLDDTFNDSEWKIEQFYRITQRLPFKIEYSCYLRADLIERFPDTAHHLKESGLWAAYHGIESLHPHASKLVGKGWSGRKGRDFLPRLYHDIWRGEVPQHLNFIAGLPRETKEDLLSTVDWFRTNNMYHLTFNALVLFESSAKSSAFMSIDSEFGKNANKYGFSFCDGQGGADRGRIWYNETWKEPEAREFVQTLNSMCRPFKKTHTSEIPAMRFLGFSREYLLNTNNIDHDTDLIASRQTAKLQEYYRLLMDL